MQIADGPNRPVYMDMKYEHIDGILAIENVSFHSPWSRISFESELLINNSARYVVAELDGKVAAYGGYWKIIDEAHITNVAVHPDHRRRGLARGILRELEAVARGEDIRFMTLEVRVGNTPAITLYESEGFISAGVRKKYYTDNNEDAYIMWKTLL